MKWRSNASFYFELVAFVINLSWNLKFYMFHPFLVLMSNSWRRWNLVRINDFQASQVFCQISLNFLTNQLYLWSQIFLKNNLIVFNVDRHNHINHCCDIFNFILLHKLDHTIRLNTEITKRLYLFFKNLKQINILIIIINFCFQGNEPRWFNIITINKMNPWLL